jgi:hypothetical protein
LHLLFVLLALLGLNFVAHTQSAEVEALQDNLRKYSDAFDGVDGPLPSLPAPTAASGGGKTQRVKGSAMMQITNTLPDSKKMQHHQEPLKSNGQTAAANSSDAAGEQGDENDPLSSPSSPSSSVVEASAVVSALQGQLAALQSKFGSMEVRKELCLSISFSFISDACSLVVLRINNLSCCFADNALGENNFHATFKF